MARLVDLALLLAGCLCLLATVYDHRDVEWQISFDSNIKPFMPLSEQTSNSLVLPRPLLADLNGDGANELVLVNGISNVLIYAHRASMTKRAFASYQSQNQQSSSLLPSLSVGSDDYTLVFTFDASSRSTAPYFPSLQRIIAVQSGFIDAYQQSTNRKQVLVLMNAALQIWCVNTTSKQTIWTKTLSFDDGDYDEANKSNDDALADTLEVQILINPSPMRINDTGVVIVGVRLADGIDGSAGHFSFVALSGQSGDVRWTHSSEHRHDDRVTSDASKVYHPSHEVHSGEVEWRNFRDAFYDALPHAWYAPSDTRFKLAHLERRSNKDVDASNKQPVKSIFNTATRSPFHVSLNARRPHDDNEHVEHPNAIVAYTSEGVELIHLYTGRALTHLQLDAFTSHADLNGDGVIDHVRVFEPESPGHSHEGAAAHSKQPPKDRKRCDLIATSGIPAQLNLYNTSLCASSAFISGAAFGWLTGSNEINGINKGNHTFGLSNGRLRGLNKPHDASRVDIEQVQEKELFTSVEAVVSGPLLLPARAEGESGTRRFTSYALSSNGWFTGTDWRGRRVLNMRTKASFDSNDVNDPIVGLRVRSYPLAVDPTAVSPDHDYVLLIGSTSLVVVDRIDSSIVDTFDLPDSNARVQLVRVGELNGDQYNDLVVETTVGVTAFIVHVHASSTFFTRAVMMLCAAIVAAILLQLHSTAQPKLEQAIKQSIKTLGFENSSSTPTSFMPTVTRRNNQTINQSNNHTGSSVIQRHTYDAARPPV